jgi:hypothetical protein
VAGASAGGAEEVFGLGTEKIELREVVGCCLGEVFTADRMSCWGDRCDQRRSLAAARKISEMDEGVLAEMLGDAGFGAGRGAFGEAGVESHLCAGVGEEKMLHDLLNVPLVGARGRVELGLGRVEPV